MWAQYRKSFVVTQIFILLILASLIYFGKTWQTALAAFFMMQVASVAGAWWGMRLKKKIEAKENELPLNRR